MRSTHQPIGFALIATLALGFGVAGCGGGSEEPAMPDQTAASEPTPSTTEPPTPSTPEPPAPAPVASGPDVAAGKTVYGTFCASCHGATGNGDGPVSAGLNPQPVKHSDGNYMNALDDAHLVKVIKLGGPAVGKSPMMAPWGGTLSDAQIADVIAFMRTLANPPYPGS